LELSGSIALLIREELFPDELQEAKSLTKASIQASDRIPSQPHKKFQIKQRIPRVDDISM